MGTYWVSKMKIQLKDLYLLTFLGKWSANKYYNHKQTLKNNQKLTILKKEKEVS